MGEVCCVWDGDSCEPRFDSPPPVPPPPSPPAAAARGTCGSLTEGKQCQSGSDYDATSNCDGGGQSRLRGGVRPKLAGCCYWRNNKTRSVSSPRRGRQGRTSPARDDVPQHHPLLSPPNDCTSIVGRKDLKDPANSAEAWYAAPDGIWCYELPASYGCEGFYTARTRRRHPALPPDGSTGDGINGYCDAGELYLLAAADAAAAVATADGVSDSHDAVRAERIPVVRRHVYAQ